MSTHFIKLDPDRCIGCRACEVHCKVKNRLPAGPRPGRLFSAGPLPRDGRLRYQNLFLPCLQCRQPWCVDACPVGAMVRREDDGLVVVNQELCVGCKACAAACPWGVPQFNQATGRMDKCDLCRDRTEQGLAPACVAGCSTGALALCEPGHAASRDRESVGRKVLLQFIGQHE